jgi:hypothetical protein
MSFDAALRLTEILLGLTLLQQSLEHFVAQRDERLLFLPRAALSVLLVLGVAPGVTCLALIGLAAAILHRFDGPYNGGSDRMSLLILIGLCLTHLLPEPHWRKTAFAYLAAQLVLSYVLSGAVKIVNPDWRGGRALRDVFLFSAYPVSEGLRRLADRPRLLLVISWCVMLFELLFPFALLTQPALVAGLAIAATFHLANAALFGLNRFVWAWLAAYPSILWLQHELAGRY